MALPPRRDRVRAFWLLVRSGMSIPDACARLGVSKNAGLRWFNKAGGVAPETVINPPTGRYLSIDERERIFSGAERGCSIREIARSIGRAPSTVKRELNRNMHAKYRYRLPRGAVRDGRNPAGEHGYRPSVAQARADQNAARPKTAMLTSNPRLRVEVQNRLKRKDSPEQISNRLRLDFPDDTEMRVSHETIYQSLYIQGRGALKRDLAVCLRTGRAMRKPRRNSTERRGRITGMVSIAERPPEVATRTVPGHWEGDLITGKDNASAIGTLVERVSGFVTLLHLPDRHGALDVQEAIIPKICALPETLRKTLTWDQGIEMSNHAQIAQATDMDIYFCDPHSPWQRGSNENTNGLLRQYFPKSTDLSGYHPDYLDFVANQLNTRPRKRLDWHTPAEALDKLLTQPPNPPRVATAA